MEQTVPQSPFSITEIVVKFPTGGHYLNFSPIVNTQNTAYQITQGWVGSTNTTVNPPLVVHTRPMVMITTFRAQYMLYWSQSGTTYHFVLERVTGDNNPKTPLGNTTSPQQFTLTIDLTGAEDVISLNNLSN